ncbi:PEP-CTERM sorting domain-containing protein [Erythrobacter sp. HKB08]|uniref:PEP-CTERM sorting domain-containing protein n=1 Tax=Erythrobacter sp. HKB08 TaxID=2502843 RepID=UPI001008AA50|nr:PEP-CTERM sorting domain-containing protein [Erythrobacter sp. HKB08]
MRTTPAILLAIFAADPAFARIGAQIPEPSNMALFGLGLAGLIVGRFIARGKRKTDED